MTWGRPSEAERRQQREREKTAHIASLLERLPMVQQGTYGGTTSGRRVEKENASQHAGYMAAVRDLGYCMHCRRACRPQFCHADLGKGGAIKTDVRRGWPGCGPGDWGPGCHWIVGTSGQYTKEQRRALEAQLAERTRAAVLAAGLWPKRLPLWSEPKGLEKS